jgi:hypothetical protein
MSEYAAYLSNWARTLTSPSMSFNYSSTGAKSETENWKLYAMALQVYNEVLRNYYDKKSSRRQTPEDYHWIPVESSHGTVITDINSGRRIHMRKLVRGQENKSCLNISLLSSNLYIPAPYIYIAWNTATSAEYWAC